MAQSQAPAKPAQDDARQKLETSKQVLDETRKREQDLKRDVELLEAERARINRNLIDTAKAIQRGEAKLTETEARLGELQAQETIVRGSLAQNEGKISKLLAAMQRMGRNPPPVMVTRREDALQMVRSAMLLAAVFPDLKEQAVLLSEKLHELVRVMTDIRRERDQLQIETQRLVDGRMKLDTLLAQKRENITERQSELKQVRQAAAELARSVTDLNELIVRMDKTVAEKTGIAEYEREIASAQAEPAKPAEPVVQVPPVAALPAPAQPQPAAPGKAEAPKPKAETTAAPAIVLKPGPGERQVALANPGRMKPSIPFDRAKGQLPMPAAGRRIVSFNERTEVGATSKGIVIETRAGARVTAPADGWVVFADQFRSYGQLLIINAGGGYYVVLAGLTSIEPAVGQFVLAGEPVGKMGDAASQGAGGRQGAKAQDATTGLYIEFRKDGRPIDPDPWWAAEGAQKVQG
jgi:septal ring factor EnvC (AmiA/AmiB activator)